ncbi:protein transport protein Sec24C-like [Eurosta solidaginis]|uniref:protein transport protein Sec24C-like n=1 Tax=Eurosta solidaginis TaxID=178769 RepID=UPI0035315127
MYSPAPPATALPGQSLPGAPNQMTINSTIMPGLPHTPQPKQATGPPQTGQLHHQHQLQAVLHLHTSKQQPSAPGTGIYQQPQQYDQAQRHLHPDQMSNPISVMIENQNSTGCAFITNQQGLLPPLVTTKYVVQDQGNSSPRYVRSSLYCIPATADLLKTTALSFTLTISPMARTNINASQSIVDSVRTILGHKEINL